MLKITLAAMGLLTLALARENVTISTHYDVYPNTTVAHPTVYVWERYALEDCKIKNCTAYTCLDGICSLAQDYNFTFDAKNTTYVNSHTPEFNFYGSGYCESGINIITSTTISSLQACLDSCNDRQDCKYFQYYPRNDTRDACLLASNICPSGNLIQGNFTVDAYMRNN